MSGARAKLDQLSPKARAEAELQLAPRRRLKIEVIDVDFPESDTLVVIRIEPIGKPRMTQRDKWAKRPCVLRYREYADKLRAACTGLPKRPSLVSWRAYFTMPESWNEKKQAAHAGKPHQSKPDRDNIDKGILDALWEQDSCVATGHLAKFWDDGRGARLEITAQ